MGGPLEPTVWHKTLCDDCHQTEPMPGALRCLTCFHRYLDRRRKRRIGDSYSKPAADRTAVVQARGLTA